MTFLPSKSDNDVVPFVEAHEKAGAFAPIVNAMAVEAIANMHRIEIQETCGWEGGVGRGVGWAVAEAAAAAAAAPEDTP